MSKTLEEQIGKAMHSNWLEEGWDGAVKGATKVAQVYALKQSLKKVKGLFSTLGNGDNYKIFQLHISRLEKQLKALKDEKQGAG